MSILLVGCEPTVWRVAPPLQRVTEVATGRAVCKVVVLPVADERPPIIVEGHARWLYLPLVPFASSSWDRPDEDRSDAVELERYLLDATRRLGACRSAVLAGDPADSLGADFVVSGTIRLTRLDQTIYVYGLSLFGLPFLLLGAPMFHDRLHVVIDLSTTRARDGLQRDLTVDRSGDHWMWSYSATRDPYEEFRDLFSGPIDGFVAQTLGSAP